MPAASSLRSAKSPVAETDTPPNTASERSLEPDGGQTYSVQCVSRVIANDTFCWRLRALTPAFREPGRVLDFAPEARRRERFLRTPGVNYISGDLAPGHWATRLDMMALPFSSDSSSGLLCCHVLEHLEDDGRAMRKARRVLRRGGWALPQFPVCLDLPEKTTRCFAQNSVEQPAPELTGEQDGSGANRVRA